ncbi:MAG: outer membrane protein transport protein [Sandaracinus sp.]|nr:outer membrane protein transport protein [Sandaracinus sp.]
MGVSMKSARWLALLALVVVSSGSSRAFAAGYDTPILYTARHLGMGGTAIGYVDDPSALFHNPAGLRHTRRISLLGDVSLLLGNITGSPSEDAIDADSETTFAPFFMLGVSGRVTDWLTMGFAVYPVASAGGTYKYDVPGVGEITDSTTLIFFEASYAVAVEVPDYNLSFGLGYRVTYVSLTRERLPTDRTRTGDYGSQATDFSASGFSFAGFRLGVQWQPIPEFEVGFSYRHKTETDIEATGPTPGLDDPPCRAPCALGSSVDSIETTFTLPSRLGLGMRMNLGDLSAAVDMEYTFQSQNERTDFSAIASGFPLTVPNVFDWKDGLTGRLGFEYRLLDGKLPLRVGYIWENRVTSRPYVTAFGTPPGTTHVATLGGGYQTDNFRIDVAYAYRTSKGRVTESQIDDGRSDPDGPGGCPFCGFAGDYRLTMHGIYVSASYSWGPRESEPVAEEDAWGPEPEPEPAPVVEPEPEPAPEPEAVEPPAEETIERSEDEGEMAPPGAPHATSSGPLPPSLVETGEEEDTAAP